MLKNLEVLDEYSSIISQKVQLHDYSSIISQKVQLHGNKISNFKSHHCHILLQQFLPLSLPRSLPKKFSLVLIKFCEFFTRYVAKLYDLDATKGNSGDNLSTRDNLSTIVLCCYDTLDKLFST